MEHHQVNLNKNCKIFFTADTHFGHSNIIKYLNRPFVDVNDMNDTLIKNWNKVVPKDGIVYHLGDVGFFDFWDNVETFLSNLNGKIRLIKGNHDWKYDWFSCLNYVKSLDTIVINGLPIVLCHYAMKIWDRKHYGALHLFGHSHGTVQGEPRSMDVGVDSNNFTPISYKQVLDKLEIIERKDYEDN